MVNFPNKKYQLIVVDPPWKIEKIRKKVRPNQVEMDYPMMSVDEIKNLPIDSISDEKCMLFLWTVDKYLHYSRSILEHWKFNYHLTMSWDKTNGQALYGFNRQTEFILVGLKGKHEAFPNRPAIKTSFKAKSPYHSRKPDEFYEMIDILPLNPRIDIFARENRDSLFIDNEWDVWGNECQ